MIPIEGAGAARGDENRTTAPEDNTRTESATVSAEATAAGTNAAMVARLASLSKSGSSAPTTKSATIARNRAGTA